MSVESQSRAASDLWNYTEVLKAIEARDRQPLPIAIALSHETYKSLIDGLEGFVSTQPSPHLKIYGLTARFDESVPFQKYRPIYESTHSKDPLDAR